MLLKQEIHELLAELVMLVCIELRCGDHAAKVLLHLNMITCLWLSSEGSLLWLYS